MNPILPPRSYFITQEILQATVSVSVSVFHEAAMFRASALSLSKQVGY
jgi:hypothetical protein